MTGRDRSAQLDALLARLGLSREDVGEDLLEQALVHRSWAVESGRTEDNERLEFLGDAVIGLVTTEYLYSERPDSDEGTLSKLRAALVSRRVLGQIATELDLGEALHLGAGERATGGAKKSSLLGSALEAVIGALYLSCPLERLKPALIEHVVRPGLLIAEDEMLIDFKSRLQEWAQAHRETLPQYEVIREEGPDHDREFEVEVSIAGEALARGTGRRKKWAENHAARHALARIEQAEAK